MLKKYTAKSCLSLSVKLPTGGTTHVSFTARTGSGSVFYTENKTLQDGLRHHPQYGKLFKEETIATPTPEKKVVEDKAKQPEVKELSMACNDDAKDYLAEKFGVSRSKLRSREDIEAVAMANGIKIMWKS